MKIFSVIGFSGDISCDFESQHWNDGMCNWEYDLGSSQTMDWVEASALEKSSKQKWKFGKFMFPQLMAIFRKFLNILARQNVKNNQSLNRYAQFLNTHKITWHSILPEIIMSQYPCLPNAQKPLLLNGLAFLSFK